MLEMEILKYGGIKPSIIYFMSTCSANKIEIEAEYK